MVSPQAFVVVRSISENYVQNVQNCTYKEHGRFVFRCARLLTERDGNEQ